MEDFIKEVLVAILPIIIQKAIEWKQKSKKNKKTNESN